MKVLIVGGGIGGLTAALALQQRGIEAIVFEQAPELKPVGAGIWVPTNAMAVLDRLGVAGEVRGRGIALQSIELRDVRGDLLQEVRAEEVIPRYGYPTVSIRRSALHATLAQRLGRFTLVPGKECRGFAEHEQRVIAQFEDGTEAAGDVLIGADGLRSRVRQQLFPDTRLRYSGQSCYRGIVQMTLPGGLRNLCRETWGRGVRFGYSPVDAETVYWFAPFRHGRGQPVPEGMRAHLTRLYRDFPHPIPDIVERTPEGVLLQTDLYDLAPLSSWGRGRVALLGDAAHATTPNLGQGGAQAIEDGFVLAECLGRSPSQQGLREYERLRRPKALRIVKRSAQIGRMAGLKNGLARGLRNLVLRNTPRSLTRRGLDEIYRLDF